jgi:SAM-dependent methyltransferase
MAVYHRDARRDAPRFVAALLAVFEEAQSFADVGAGSGVFAAELIRRGKQAIAFERSTAGRVFARLQGVEARRFDLSADQPRIGEWEVAYCLEVAEHLPAPFGPALVATLVAAAPVVVFSAAAPGQGGLGHINEQPPEYWIAAFEAGGGGYDSEATFKLRARLAEYGVAAPWYRDNPLVFRRVDGA